MGMNLVELVIRVEETFAIDLPDEDCSLIRTVGDLFRLTLGRLKLPYQSVAELQKSQPGRDYSQRRFPNLTEWTASDVWMTLRGIVTDQLQAAADEVHEISSFQDDLLCD